MPETVTDFEAALFADHLVLVVFALALAMQWALHRVTERLPNWHIALPAAVTLPVWAFAGWHIGGASGTITFALGMAASLALAVIDERIRLARGNRQDSMHFG